MKATDLKKLKAMYSQLEQMQSDLESLREAEQEAHNNRSEKWQEGEAGEASSERISELEQAEGYLQDAMNSIESAHGSIGE